MTINKFYGRAALGALVAHVASLAQPAVAHSGVHGEISLSAAFQHVTQSPYHMGLGAAAIGFVLLMLWLAGLRHRRR